MHHSFWHYIAIAAIVIPVLLVIVVVLFWESITSNGQNPFE